MTLEIHVTKGAFSRTKNQEQRNKYLSFASLSSIAPLHESESRAKPRRARNRAKNSDAGCELSARKFYHDPALSSFLIDMPSSWIRHDNNKIASLLAIMLFAVFVSEIAAADASLSSGFLNSGCAIDGYRLNCSSLQLEERFGCYEIANASEALEGLDPQLPIVECYSRVIDGGDRSSERGSDGGGDQKGLVRVGCMLPAYRNYIVAIDGDFRLIESKEEFAALFAPVRSPDEAMAFAVALTDSFPLYDRVAPEGYFPVSPAATPSSAEEKDGAFAVHLFDQPICGCSTHPYYAVDYLVTKEGNVTELSRRMVYDSNNQICFD